MLLAFTSPAIAPRAAGWPSPKWSPFVTRLLHISDVHLGAPLGGFGDVARERARKIRDAFRQLPERAADWDVDATLVAGDLFDGPDPAPADVDLAREVLRALADLGPVIAVPGNHDPDTGSESPWRQMPDPIRVLTDARFGRPVSFELSGGSRLHVYGLAYDPAVEPEPLAGFRRADADGWHVVLVHAATADNPDWDAGRSLRVTRTALGELDADYVALGDYHGFRPPAEFGAPACYPGSFAGVAVDETGPRGCAVVELGDGGPRVRLQTSPVEELLDLGEVDVGAAENDRAVEELVGARVTGACYPVVTLTGVPAFPLDAARVRAALRERFGFAVVHDRTRFIASDHVARLAREPTVTGHVARAGLERVEGAADVGERERAERALRLALRALEETP